MGKTCYKCKQLKSLDEFYKDKYRVDGRTGRCISCTHEYDHRPEVKARRDRRQRARPADHAARKRKQEQAKLNNESQVFRDNNPELVMVYSARRRAKKKQITFTITKEDIYIPEMCPVLHIPIFRKGRVATDHSPSLDRMDSEVGYVPDNVRVISHRANTLKNDGSPEEHRLVAEWITGPRAAPEPHPDCATVECGKSVYNMFCRARRRSIEKGLPFDLNQYDVIMPERCPVLRIPLDARGFFGRRHDGSPSLDRIEPSLGYVKGNIAVISDRANRIKSNGTAEEHIRIALWMESPDLA